MDQNKLPPIGHPGPGATPPRPYGVARMIDSPTAVAIYFDRELDDDELRQLHDGISAMMRTPVTLSVTLGNDPAGTDLEAFRSHWNRLARGESPIVPLRDDQGRLTGMWLDKADPLEGEGAACVHPECPIDKCVRPVIDGAVGNTTREINARLAAIDESPESPLPVPGETFIATTAAADVEVKYNFPSFDDWFKAKHDGRAFEELHMRDDDVVAVSIRSLGKEIAAYVSDIAALLATVRP